jgi:hypothetical protein
VSRLRLLNYPASKSVEEATIASSPE